MKPLRSFSFETATSPLREVGGVFRWGGLFLSLFLFLILSPEIRADSSTSTNAPTRTLPTFSGSSNPSGPAVVGGPDEDIRDIRGIVHVPEFWDWLIPILIGLGILLLLALIIFFIRKWRRNRTVPVIPPHELALSRLHQARSLMTPENGKAFSIEVSDTIRHYIEARFGEGVTHETTEEFLHQLLEKPGSPLASYNTQLADFLRYCDLAKFARWSLTPGDMDSMIRSALVFVEETKPRPPQAGGGK